MAYTPLSTDFKDDILDSSNYKRKYKQVVNNDGTFSFQDETTYQQVGSNYGAKEVNEEREAINNIYENKLVALDDVALVTEEGFFVDALAVKELNSKLTKANNDITAINNIIKNVEIKKTNLKVAANSDFRWTWDLPTISGYYPLEVLTWNFHGDYDLWLNVSTAARYSTSNQFGIEGHNFGNGTANVTLYIHILYIKNGFCSYVKA